MTNHRSFGRKVPGSIKAAERVPKLRMQPGPLQMGSACAAGRSQTAFGCASRG